ncbi:hypothetical protein RN001_011487 [Aquatica leii]|uniref:Uncharacterized protein n=1 Tax=Aquatica leii TaxID=1421715 RepID=A0AAN7NXF4_9COLE|nr:hypothetical protein RN001_011487 [Aquatica leii]
MKEVSLSNVLNSFSSIAGIADSFLKAQNFNSDHTNHDWLIPPIFEKFHLLYDLIIHSPFAKKLVLNLKETKLYKTFADESGNFSLRKFGELMENHSFRKRWIHSVSYKIAQVIVRVFDPNLRTSILTLVQSYTNNLLKMEGFPKSAFLNINEPVESVSAFLNYVSKRFFGYNVQSKKQVKIIWDSLRHLHDNVLFGQYFNTQMDAEHVSNTLTNILNLEIIEPVAKTYRAYRFARKHKECDRYVMCLVNSYDPHSTTNLPVIKNLLTKVATLISSWFLSQHTNTSYYSLIMSIIGNSNCKKAFYKACDGFHAEEFRVKQEYTHFEL